ncbi:hypothetical protein KPB2_5504 [Klebsiella pneumoniae Kb677]|nr:hypothetical protein KPB2_5504 [Klebsiella pneumoniae Kb677]
MSRAFYGPPFTKGHAFSAMRPKAVINGSSRRNHMNRIVFFETPCPLVPSLTDLCRPSAGNRPFTTHN